MDRRKFIQAACTACLSATAVSLLGTGCTPTQYIQGKMEKDGLRIRKEDFRQGAGSAYSSFIIVRNEALLFPICVFRLAENEYSAVWMKCTHQGATLNASGDMLQCPAHGSEFDNRGRVSNGPAISNLRSFPVTLQKDELFIDLRKQ